MPDILAQQCHGLIEFLLELCVLRQRSLPRLHGLLILLHGRVGRRGRRLCPLPRKRHDVAGGGTPPPPPLLGGSPGGGGPALRPAAGPALAPACSPPPAYRGLVGSGSGSHIVAR